MRLLPVVLIPNINQNILNQPFYKYVIDDALKINNEIFIITNKKNLNYNSKIRYKKIAAIYFNSVSFQTALQSYC